MYLFLPLLLVPKRRAIRHKCPGGVLYRIYPSTGIEKEVALNFFKSNQNYTNS